MEATDNFEQVAESLLMTNTSADDAEVTEAEDDTAPQDATEPDEVDSDQADADETAEETDHEEQAEIEEADADPEGQQDRITVKVDGKDVAVTLDDLKRSYSGHAYVQKGMQENAEMRKQLEQHFYTLQAERNRVVELVQQAQEGGLNVPQAPSKELLRKDPIAYWEAKADYDEAVTQYQGQVQQIQQMTAQQQQAEAQMRDKYLNEQMQALQTMVPELADPQKAEAARNAILKTARDAYGFSDDELNGIVDARHVQVLNDARKWRELQASKGTATEKARQARPVTKPATRRGEGGKANAKKTAERMRQTGSVEDVANFLLTGN